MSKLNNLKYMDIFFSAKDKAEGTDLLDKLPDVVALVDMYRNRSISSTSGYYQIEKLGPFIVDSLVSILKNRMYFDTGLSRTARTAMGTMVRKSLSKYPAPHYVMVDRLTDMILHDSDTNNIADLAPLEAIERLLKANIAAISAVRSEKGYEDGMRFWSSRLYSGQGDYIQESRRESYSKYWKSALAKYGSKVSFRTWGELLSSGKWDINSQDLLKLGVDPDFALYLIAARSAHLSRVSVYAGHWEAVHDEWMGIIEYLNSQSWTLSMHNFLMAATIVLNLVWSETVPISTCRPVYNRLMEAGNSICSTWPGSDLAVISVVLGQVSMEWLFRVSLMHGNQHHVCIEADGKVTVQPVKEMDDMRGRSLIVEEITGYLVVWLDKLDGLSRIPDLDLADRATVSMKVWPSEKKKHKVQLHFPIRGQSWSYKPDETGWALTETTAGNKGELLLRASLKYTLSCSTTVLNSCLESVGNKYAQMFSPSFLSSIVDGELYSSTRNRGIRLIKDDDFLWKKQFAECWNSVIKANNLDGPLNLMISIQN